MFGFLQGFAYGLFLSCLPWFLMAMADPRLALPTEVASRWRAILRYWFIVPFIAFALWLTSLWGGFHPSLLGWLAGLGGVAVALPIERRWRQWRSRRLARRQARVDAVEAARHRAVFEQAQREDGVAVLDPKEPPVAADNVVLALCRAKQNLLEARRADLATQADRLYTRYTRVLDTLAAKFDRRELTFGRSQSMVADVCLVAADNLNTMSSLAAGVVGIDHAFVRRRLKQQGKRLHADERDALQQRLDLVADTERRLNGLTARNEAAMTTLDNAAVVMARVQTDRPQAAVDADQALHDLTRFLDKADRYANER